MAALVKLSLGLVVLMSLSGCITVKCPDGSTAKDRNGNEVKVNSFNYEYDYAADQYCPKRYTPLIEGQPVVENPPPGPTPTNVAPAIGGLVVGGAALGLGGNGGNGGDQQGSTNTPTTPVVVPTPTPPVTSTTRTR